ncbi:hypothetical protein VTI28DRAFT_4480 [Corynascus sepedonium]
MSTDANTEALNARSMKFLCLPGAFSSAAHFNTQLQPLISRLEKQGIGQFTFTQGQHETTPPPGFEQYFGPPPVYRFIDFHGLYEEIRNFPAGEEHEDTMRLFVDNPDHCTWSSVVDAMDVLFQVIEADPDIQVCANVSP